MVGEKKKREERWCSLHQEEAGSDATPCSCSQTPTLFLLECVHMCVCVCLCLVFLYRNLLPTGSNTELCHSVKHFSWCTQKENYNLHGVWKRKGSAVRHEDSWYPTEDVIFSCAWGPLCLFKEILASKNIRWWKRWPVSQWMERFEVRMWPHWGVRVCNCVCVNIWVWRSL